MKHFYCDFRVQHLNLRKIWHISFLLVPKSEILYINYNWYVSFAVFPILKQNLMQMHCSVLSHIVKIADINARVTSATYYSQLSKRSHLQYVSYVAKTCTNMSRLVGNTFHPVNNHYNSNWTNLVYQQRFKLQPLRILPCHGYTPHQLRANLCTVVVEKKKNVCAGDSWEEVVMLWVAVTTQFTNDKCALVVQPFCLRNLWYECRGSGWIQASVSQPSPPWCISGCETRDGLTSSTQHPRITNSSHGSIAISVSRTAKLKCSFVREVKNRAEAVFPAGWSTTCLDVIPLQTNTRQHCGIIYCLCV
jgi:hypothetical protein